VPVQPKTMEEGARSLVERSRAGDQNAMALIAQIRQRALFGRDKIPQNERLVAMTSYKLIGDYLQNHPVGNIGVEGAEPPVSPRVLSFIHPDVPEWMPVALPECLPKKKGFMAVVVRLANGRELTPDDLGRASQVMGPENANHVVAGAMKQAAPPGLDHIARTAFVIGVCLGTAMTLQAVREGRAPIRMLSPEAAWELGE
jgi:hypothetical protein